MWLDFGGDKDEGDAIMIELMIKMCSTISAFVTGDLFKRDYLDVALMEDAEDALNDQDVTVSELVER